MINKSENIKAIAQDIDYGKDPSPEEIDILIKALHSEDQSTVTRAGYALTILDKPIVLKVINNFTTFPYKSQFILIPLLAACNFFEIHKFLLSLLRTDTDKVLIDHLTLCLSKTHYFFLPLIFAELSNADNEYRQRIKKLLKLMGYQKTAPYLALFPELPFETFFRETFGDEEIDKILH